MFFEERSTCLPTKGYERAKRCVARISSIKIHRSDHFQTRTWGTINLPIGNYSLLFYVATTDIFQRTFALDDIAVTSCDYQPYEPLPGYSLLTLSCDFDNDTMCDMENGDGFSKPTFNFTVVTGDTMPNPDLGPTRDHTSNSSTGGFLYWDRQLPFTTSDQGRVHPANTILQNFGMCLRFAYYVNSTAVDKNGTVVSVSAGGCYATGLWSVNLDDSQGWQLAVIPMLAFTCAETFYFDVWQVEPVPVSVAFDDIEIAQCKSFEPTTTTVSTTTSTTVPTSISTPRSSTSTATVTTQSSTTSTTSTPFIITTTRNDANRQISLCAFSWVLSYVLLLMMDC